MSCKIQAESLHQEKKKDQKQAGMRTDQVVNVASCCEGFSLEKRQELDESAYNERNNSSMKQIHQEKEPKHEEWTHQDEARLLELHNQKGNRWVQIARQLGRSDNSVKNHYHSKFRKTLRKINRVITDSMRNQLRPLKNIVISKLIQTAEGLYSDQRGELQEQARIAFELKNRLLKLSSVCQQYISEEQFAQIKNLVGQVQNFCKDSKSKGRNKGEDKNPSNKYKGKEILSLLTQNTRNNVQPEKDQIPRRPTSFGNYFDDKNQREKTKGRSQKKVSEQVQNKNLERQINSSQNQSFHPFLFMNQGLIQMAPMFYPIFPQPNSLFFSGRESSFSCYNGVRQSGEQCWPTMSSVNDSKREGDWQETRKLSGNSSI